MNNQRGTVFFYILIGVALFAALSYAVSQTLRVSSGSGEQMTGSIEKMNMYKSDLDQFLEAIQLRINMMVISDGVNEKNIDFRTTKYLLGNNTQNCWNTNPGCTTASCRVFAPDSPDGIQPIIFEQIASKTLQTSAGRPKNGHAQINQAIIEGVGSPAPDMVLQISGINPVFCNFYNSKQGITTNFTDSSVFEDIGETLADSRQQALGGCATAAVFNATNIFGDQATQFAGKRTFCAPADYSAFRPTLRIWHVLRAR